ncbi:MAG: class I SAM-dependent methyltransferase [Patescibacteria group bacterium]
MSRYLNPKTYFNWFYKRFFLSFLYDSARVNAEEDNKLSALGGDRATALNKLNVFFKAGNGREFDYQNDSIHSLLFAIISLHHPISRILEIGTFSGESTRLLAQLFPDAEIITVDLPEDDLLLRAYYKRGSDKEYQAYLEKQEKNLASPNIRLIKINSFFLNSKVSGMFNLIWIDGGHLYPEVAWDICNAWNLCAPRGIILCDDVLPYKKLHKSPYHSSESFEVLQYVANRSSASPTLFLKRRNSNLYPFLLKRKYVACLQKPALP